MDEVGYRRIRKRGLPAHSVCCCSSQFPGLRAQSTSPTSAETPETVTLEHISARLEGLETSTTIEPEIRDAAINLFRDAQFQVELSRSHARTAREYQAVLDSAPSQLERIHAELSGALEQSVDLGLSENAETLRLKTDWRRCRWTRRRSPTSATGKGDGDGVAELIDVNR